MAQANLRLGDGAFMDKSKTLDPVLSQIARAFGHDSIIRREDSEGSGFATVEANAPESELFTLAERVDLAEKAFHNALVGRNKAHIAYFREPNILTREAFESCKES